MPYIGIDPGMNGGISAIDGKGKVFCSYAMPETESDTNDIFIDFANYCKADKFELLFAAIERVHSMPKQGVASSFKFGQGYGFLRGLLIANKIPFAEVSPQVWQKQLGCLSHGDKNVTKARAQQLYPGIKVTHKNADSLLIATYCYNNNRRQ